MSEIICKLETNDIFKQNNRGKTYSNIDYKKLYMALDINPDKLLENVKELPENDIDDSILSYIVFTSKMTTITEGPVTRGNESKKSDFIHPLLNISAYKYRDKNVTIRREKEIDGDIITGDIEYVLVDNYSILIV